MTDEGRFAPVVRFVTMHHAYPLAGRLRADGIDARVVPQQESMYPYGPQGHGVATYSVIVPERDGARARWVIDHLGAEEPTDAGPP